MKFLERHDRGILLKKITLRRRCLGIFLKVIKCKTVKPEARPIIYHMLFDLFRNPLRTNLERCRCRDIEFIVDPVYFCFIEPEREMMTKINHVTEGDIIMVEPYFMSIPVDIRYCMLKIENESIPFNDIIKFDKDMVNIYGQEYIESLEYMLDLVRLKYSGKAHDKEFSLLHRLTVLELNCNKQ